MFEDILGSGAVVVKKVIDVKDIADKVHRFSLTKPGIPVAPEDLEASIRNTLTTYPNIENVFSVAVDKGSMDVNLNKQDFFSPVQTANVIFLTCSYVLGDDVDLCFRFTENVKTLFIGSVTSDEDDEWTFHVAVHGMDVCPPSRFLVK